MFGSARCDLCDIIIVFRSRNHERRFTGICKDCRTEDKLKEPIIIINRLLAKKSLDSITPFEEFTIYYSGVIVQNRLHKQHKLMRRLHRRLKEKFEF